MNERKYYMIKKIVTMLFVLLFVFACDGGQKGTDDKNIMKIGSITSSSETSYEYQCEVMFANKIEEYTNGTIKTEYYPASQLGSSTELVENVAIGTVQSTLGICYDIYANIEPICIISCMPYLFDNYEHFRAFLETDNNTIKKVNSALADESNILVLGYIYRAARVTITNEKGIYGPDDFSGMKVRSPESAVNVKWLEAMNAMPLTITWSELYTSLSQGAASGAENSITTIVDSNLQEIVDYCSETNHMMAVNLLTVNKTWFDSLNTEQQIAIKKAAEEVTKYSWDAFQDAIDIAWKKFEEAGVTCIRLNEIDFNEFKNKSSDVYKNFVQEGFFTEEDYNTILNLEY